MNQREPCTVFILSPADCGGKRAQILLNPGAEFPLATRLRGGEAVTLGEAFTFMSQLYFRGKLAYARAFANPPVSGRGVLVIAPGVGLMDPDAPVRPETLRRMATVRIDPSDSCYRGPLETDAARLAGEMDAQDEAVFLGSIATGKYLDVLRDVFGAQLRVPQELIGRGSLSRGALLLRCADTRRRLTHVTVGGSIARVSAGRGDRPGPRAPEANAAFLKSSIRAYPARVLKSLRARD